MREKLIKKNVNLLTFVLLAMLLFSQLAYAQNVFGFKTSVDWILIAYLVIFIVLSLLGISFMISKIFALPQLEAWAKEEFVNVLFSIAILAIFSAFVGVIEQLSNSIANDILSSKSREGALSYWSYKPSEGRWNIVQTSNPNCPPPCHFYIARGFLGSIYEKYGDALKNLAQYYFLSHYFSTFSTGTGFDIAFKKFVFSMGFGYPLHADLTILNNIFYTVVSEYLKIITSLKMQEIALGYLPPLAGVLFVIGIITRSVWFLRKFAGLMIAIGIGLYAIFPLTYVLGWYIIDQSIATVSIDLPEQDLFKAAGASAIGLGDIDILFTDFNDKGLVTKLGVLDALGRAYIPIIVLPILALFTTLGFVRHFSPMIGGDPEIAGLTRII